MRDFKHFALSRKTLLFALILISVNCTVKYISDYDEETDRAVTQLQREMEGTLIKLKRFVEEDNKEEASYANYEKFYDDVKTDISAIRLRAAAIPKNQITLKQINLLENAVTNLEKLHKLGFSDLDEIDDLRDTFNTQFTAILKLELAKKRGE